MKKIRIPFMKVGTHTDIKGNVMEFTESDLKAIATHYNPKDHEAPMVVGHPKTDNPAYGWVESIEYDETTQELVAVGEPTDAQFAEQVESKKYKKISPAFYPKDSLHNPVKGKAFGLRHIDFLGTVPPAVKDLSPIEFNDLEQFIAFEFSEANGKETENPEADQGREHGNMAKLLKRLD